MRFEIVYLTILKHCVFCKVIQGGFLEFLGLIPSCGAAYDHEYAKEQVNDDAVDEKSEHASANSSLSSIANKLGHKPNNSNKIKPKVIVRAASQEFQQGIFDVSSSFQLSDTTAPAFMPFREVNFQSAHPL